MYVCVLAEINGGPGGGNSEMGDGLEVGATMTISLCVCVCHVTHVCVCMCHVCVCARPGSHDAIDLVGAYA